MKNNKKKGFTLVELLVVIAILAILATVATVGYTAFIESATVSNDENVAAQLNNFLVALKADSNGEYYAELQANGGKVTANNVREITDYILADSGLGKLIPQSADYGYHFYFDLVEQEYVLIGDKDDRVNTQAMINAIFAAEIPNVIMTDYPETQITKNARYFLVETGTPLADIMTAFRGVENKEDLAALKTAVENTLAKNNRPYKGLVDYLNSVVFVTSEGRLVTDLTATHTNLIIQSGLALSADKENNKLVSFSGTPSDTVINPFVTVSEKVVIPMTLVEGVVLQTNAWMFDYGNDETRRPVLEFVGINTVAELQEHIDIGFTNALILLGDTYYYFDGSDIKNLNGEVAGTVENKNTVKDFTVSCDAVEAGVLTFGASGTDTYTLYIHYNKTDAFNLNVGGFVGELSNENIYGTENISFNKVNGGSSKLSVSADGTVQVTGLPETDDCAAVIKVTCGDVVKTINVQIVRHTNANITLNGQTFNMVQGGTFVIKQTSESTSNTYSFTSVLEDAYFELDDTLSVTTDKDNCFTITNNVLKLNDTDFEGAQTINVSVGGVLVKTFTVVVQDYKNNAFVVGLPNYEKYLYRVGNQNAFKLGYIFDLSSDDKVLSDDVTLKIYDASKPIANSNSWALASDSTNIKVNANSVTLTPAEWDAHEINFNKTSGVAIIEVEYRGMTTRAAVEVVNGYNVTDYSELQTASGKNNVLLGDIVMPESKSFTVAKNTYFFGNGFTFNVEKGKITGAVISVSDGAVLDNTVVIGAEYNTINMVSGDYFCSTVWLNPGGTISNCYITGTRSPVYATGGLIDNTVLEGGILANLILPATNGNPVTVRDLTTINQPVGDKPCGLGIFLDNFDGTILNIQGTLTQYNWVSDKDDDNFTGYASTLHSLMFGSSMSAIQFEHDGKKWVNTGILVSSEYHTINGTPSNYVRVENSYGGFTGIAYTFDSSKNTFNGKPEVPTYVPTTQAVYKPVITFNSSSIKPSTSADGLSYINVDAAKWTINIGMDPANASHYRSIDLSTLFNYYKYSGQNLVASYEIITTRENGYTLEDNVVTFTNSGTYIIRLKLKDTLFFDAAGKSVESSIEYTKDITVVVSNTNIPNATIDISGLTGEHYFETSGYNIVVYDYEFQPMVPVLNGLVINDYELDENGDPVSVTITPTIEQLVEWYNDGTLLINGSNTHTLYEHNGQYYIKCGGLSGHKVDRTGNVSYTFNGALNNKPVTSETKVYEFYKYDGCKNRDHNCGCKPDETGKGTIGHDWIDGL